MKRLSDENYRAANEFKVEKWIEINVAEEASIEHIFEYYSNEIPF